MKPGPKTKDLKDRFEDSYNEIPNGCWEWQKGTLQGYGNFWITPTKRIGAHRMSYKLYVDENLPEYSQDTQVNHTCDNPLCVNPEHLYLGTHKENMNDATTRKRRKTKLTEEQVKEIRESNEGPYVIAHRMKINSNTVYSIRKNETRRYV